MEANTFLPDNPKLTSDCSEEDVSSISLEFKGFKLSMQFRKTPGGERFYVSHVELSYSSSNPLLKQVDRPNLPVSDNPWDANTTACRKKTLKWYPF